MWGVEGYDLRMAEGDFGVKLPITVHETTLTEHDALKLTFKKNKNGECILEKEYTGTDIENNTANLEFTEEESAKFPPGLYVYCLDWYQSGVFMCNLIDCAVFKVVDKA